ncbi:MAG: hypothetical protein AABX30_02320 [Nanoarchaeota archaeon]
MVKRGAAWKIILIVLVLIVLVAATYFTFFFKYTCNDLACFQSHQEKCAKTIFLSQGTEIDWKYSILGKKSGSCKINVELLKVKKGSLDLMQLQGKAMDCYLPVGSIASPESDLAKCNGLLKEGVQEMMINKLYSYILDNVGTINEELKKVV